MMISMYGSDLRTVEAYSLRVKGISFAMNKIVVRLGKGLKRSSEIITNCG